MVFALVEPVSKKSHVGKDEPLNPKTRSGICSVLDLVLGFSDPF
jgi:hypothetical protein